MPTKQATIRPKGKLIVFEGLDRSGKSSVVKRIAEMFLKNNMHITVCGELHSPFRSELRKMLREGSTPFLKTYLFASDRAWEYESKCLPALEKGEMVLWDRYVDSAIVYRTVELRKIKSFIDINFVKSINSPFISPDLTIYIDISTETALKRAKASGSTEPYDASFLKKVRICYMKLAIKKNYSIINGELPLQEVVETAYQVILKRFKEFFP